MAGTLSNSEFKLIGPRGGEIQSGSAATLSCHLSPELSAVGMEIRWFKGTDCVCLYKNRQVTEGRSYEGRVSLITQELERGIVSLQIRNFRRSDRGFYLHQVTSGDTTEECTVRVDIQWISVAKDVIVEEVFIIQRDREWTEEERMKMKESALLTEFKEDMIPGPVLKNLMSLIEETKAQEEQLKEAETELEDTVKQTHSKEDDGERKCIREIRVKIREMQERRVKERLEMREREEVQIREKIRVVLEALRSSDKVVLKVKKIEQHKKLKREREKKLSEEKNEEKKRELERDVKREDKQIKEFIQELKKLQEKRKRMVMELKLEMENREKSVKEDTLLIEFEQSVQTVVTQKLKEYERKMDEKDRELEALKQKLSETEKDKEKLLEERNKNLEEKNKELKEKNSALEEQGKAIERKNKTIEEKNKLLREKERVLEKNREEKKEVEGSKEQLETLGKELQDKSSELQEIMILLEQQKTELREKNKELEEKERLLRERDTQLMEREKQVEEKDGHLEEKNKQLQKRTDPDPSAPVKRRDSMQWISLTKEELSANSTSTPSYTDAAELLSIDTKIFVPEETEVTLVDGTTTCYRFQCPHTGQFQCKFTSLVFEMEGKGEVLYRIVSWDARLLDGLGQMQPAGPLYEIDCKGSIRHMHLPHCEILSDESQVQQAVARFTAGNVEIIPPLRVTTTHVIICIQGLSRFGLVSFRKLLKTNPISGQVLLFHKKLSLRQRMSKLHIHLLPRNVPVEEVKKKHLSSKYIDTSSKCQLTPGTKYSPSCDPYVSQPKFETFECDYGPNYHPTFEVFIDIDAENATIGLLDKDKQEVWEPRLVFLTDISRECVKLQTDAERVAFVDHHREQLIQRVSSVMKILDCLETQKMISKEMYDNIKVAEPSQKQMRILYDVLHSGGTAVKVEFYKILKRKQQFLVDDLEAGPSKA